MTHPCNQCDFEATSARQLSRHKAITHIKNPLKCVLCPFITAYQTNLLRHRREVHGILGSKGNKSCKFCGFEAEDNDTLIMHQQEVHLDILRTARERFAREKKSASARGNASSNSDNEYDAPPNDAKPDLALLNSSLLNLASLTKDNGLLFPSASIFSQSRNLPESGQDSGEHSPNDDDEKDFWKEGFVDNPASLTSSFGQLYPQNSSLTSNFLANFQKNFNSLVKNSSPCKNGQLDLSNLNGLAGLNGLGQLTAINSFDSLNALNSIGNGFVGSPAYPDDCSPDGSECSGDSRPESRSSNISGNLQIDVDNLMPEVELHEMNGQRDQKSGQHEDDLQTEAATASSFSNLNQKLAPTRIRRQYTCPDCEFRTVNPREFLYHRRDVHSQKVKIVECPYCVYACQYFQKLQRHMLLVHKLETSITPPNENGQFVKQQTMINQSQVCTTKKDFFVKKSSSKSLLSCKIMENDEASLEIDKNEPDQDDEFDSNSMPTDEVNFQSITDGTSADSAQQPGLNTSTPEQSTSSSVTLCNPDEDMVRVFNCCYCDFSCYMPFEFHAHFLQHIDTKPLTSICERVCFLKPRVRLFRMLT